MGRAEVGTPKWISNKIKAKGLQKLRWYCQMCQKQCRDDNGFKCHTSSESHQRQLLLFGENPQDFLSSFSREFEKDFLYLLSRQYGTKRVFANAVYQDYIHDRHHVHMNSTRWHTLTGFVQYLGRTGKCIIDETPKGWYISWVDRDPETIAREEAKARKGKMIKDDEERLTEFVNKQVAWAKEEGNSSSVPSSQFTDLERNDAEEPIRLTMNSDTCKNTPSALPNVFKTASDLPNKNKRAATEIMSNHHSSKKAKKISSLEQIMLEGRARQERKSATNGIKEDWLFENIVVKIMAESLGEKYYRQKAYVKEIVDKYTAIVVTISSQSNVGGSRVKLDQSQLETVIPALGRHVLIVNGIHRGKKAILKEIQVDKFCASLQLISDKNDVITLPYEHFSKLYSAVDS